MRGVKDMPQSRQTARHHYRPASSYNMGYVDGNTVRKLEPAPYETERERRQREQVRRERAKRAQEAKRREARRAKNQAIAVKNRARVLKIDLKYTLFLGIAVAATLVMCIYYLSLQSQMTSQNKKIASLKSELTALVDENQATQERLNNAIDLEAVFETATTALGMDYPSQDQIIYYSGSGDDYVKQYKEIPQSDE